MASFNDSSTEWCHHDLPDSPFRNSCKLTNEDSGRLDAVAMIRMIASLIGLLGASSIILSAVIRKRVFSAEIHPIFMLSLADCVLSALWISGSSIWLSDMAYSHHYNRTYCYPLTLLTAIFECVALNLTLVYSILAYLRTKNTELNSLLIPYGQKRRGMSIKTLILMYIMAWLLPTVIITTVFMISAVSTGFLSMAQSCSCWCRPTVINILPFTSPGQDTNSSTFMNKQFSFVLSLAAIIAIQYVIVFSLLLVLYIKTLLKIRSFKKEYESHKEVYHYGATAIIARGQSRAAKKVTLFLTVFVFSGLFNLCCTLLIFIFLVKRKDDFGNIRDVYYTFLFAQSLTLPLQGFMNAIVYGWTRDDFVSTISYPLQHEQDEDNFTTTDHEDNDNDIEESYSSTNCTSPRHTI